MSASAYETMDINFSSLATPDIELRVLMRQACRTLSAEAALLFRLADGDLQFQMAVSPGTDAGFDVDAAAAVSFIGGIAADLLATAHAGLGSVAIRSLVHEPVRLGPASELCRSLILLLRCDPSATWLLVLMRTAQRPPFNSFDEAEAGRLQGWFGTCLTLWQRLSAESARVSGLQTALDAQNVAALLLDRKARLIYTNQEGRLLLQAGDGLRRAGHFVTAANLADGVRLQSAIAGALSQQSGKPGASGAPTLLCIRRTGDRRPLTIAAVGLGRRAMRDSDPAVMLFVSDPEVDHDHAIDPACDIYRLTATERRLTKHLVAGLPLADAAKRMQIKSDVARGYLKRVFLKTGTNRQAELVRLMLAGRAPTRPGSHHLDR